MAELIGGRELSARLHAVNDARTLLGKLQVRTVYNAKKLVPRKTGNLGRSIAPGAFLGRAALVVARANYAAPVELGSRPHEIRPRKGRALRFAARGTATTLGGRPTAAAVRGGGAYVFATKVMHPGNKPRPFLLPGAKKAVTDGGLKDTVVELWNGAA